MSESIKPICGATPQAVFSKMRYISGAAAEMFSSCERSRDRKEMIPMTKLPGVTIAKLWDGVFADSADFLKIYHGSRNETNLDVSKWEFSQDMGSGCRTVSLTTIIDFPRPGTATPLNQAYRFAYTKKDNNSVLLVLHISSHTPQVTGGSTFRTEAVMEFSAASEDEDCTVCAFGGCKSVSFKFTAVKAFAVPRALREMTAGYQKMIQMILKTLTGGTVQVETPDVVDDGADNAAGDDKAGEGSAGDGQEPSALLQGLLLALAVIVAIVLLWSMSTLRGAVRISATMADRIRDGPVGFAQSSIAGTINTERGAMAGAGEAPATQRDILRQAARDAQIQSLRYRWLEQRAAIASLESSVSSLWWIATAQIFCIVFLFVKAFVF